MEGYIYKLFRWSLFFKEKGTFLILYPLYYSSLWPSSFNFFFWKTMHMHPGIMYKIKNVKNYKKFFKFPYLYHLTTEKIQRL